jgi:hypothetical protein
MVKMALLVVLGLVLFVGCATSGPQNHRTAIIKFDGDPNEYHIEAVRDYDNYGLTMGGFYLFKYNTVTRTAEFITVNAAAQQGILKTIGEQVIPAFADIGKSFILGPLAASFYPTSEFNIQTNNTGGNMGQSQFSLLNQQQSVDIQNSYKHYMHGPKSAPTGPYIR